MEWLSIRALSFRNLAPDRVSFCPGINVIAGANGQGKTNLLEAVVMVANLRSFQTRFLHKIVCHDEPGFRITGEVSGRRGRMVLEHAVEIGPPVRRELYVNGRAAKPAEYLRLAPVEAISRDDRRLVAGSPQLRRAFLDRFAFFLEPDLFGLLRRYRHLLAQRNAGLRDGRADGEIEVWERPLAAAAAGIVSRRLRATGVLAEDFGPIYRDLAGRDFPMVELRYRSEPWLEPGDEAGLAKQYEERYAVQRARDCQAGFTLVGPHRHDLVFQIAGRAVRDYLSAGQLKVLAAALRLTGLRRMEALRGDTIPVLIDDIDAELDDHVLRRLVRMAGDGRQLFLTSAHAERVPRLARAASWRWMTAGACLGEALGEKMDE